MPGIGSPAWVAALDASLRALDRVDGGDVVVQHELLDTGATWHVVVTDGVPAAHQGRHAAPDVTFTQEEATAAAINAGELSAQTAFIDGRLRVRGDVGLLADVARLLGAMPHVPTTGGGR